MKPGRNDPCPCGSGKKYKKCCYLTGQNALVKNYLESQNIQDNDEFYNDDTDDDNYDREADFINGINNLRRFFLDKKPHIRKYYKIRDMHSEIVNTMIQYHNDGKFNKQIDTDFVSKQEHAITVDLLECDFDLNTNIGAQAFYDMLIYKTAANMICITYEI